MTSQTGQQIITIHTLSNITRSKGNQTMKFDQLIECNMRNIFLEKSYTKCGGEASPRPFYKKSKLIISLDQQCETRVLEDFLAFFLLLSKCCSKVRRKLYSFSISRLVLKSYEPKNLLDRRSKAYKILSEVSNVHFYFIHGACI